MLYCTGAEGLAYLEMLNKCMVFEKLEKGEKIPLLGLGSLERVIGNSGSRKQKWKMEMVKS